MRKGMAIGVIGWAAALVFPATALMAQSNEQITPLAMKTGGWQTTMTGKYTGLPAQVAAAVNPTMTYKNCVKPEDVTGHTWARDVVGKCSTVTVLKSTATDADIEAKDCQVGDGMTAEGRGKFHLVDSEHLTGMLDVTFSGSSPFGGSGPIQMHAEYTSNWIGAACPADM